MLLPKLTVYSRKSGHTWATLVSCARSIVRWYPTAWQACTVSCKVHETGLLLEPGPGQNFFDFIFFFRKFKVRRSPLIFFFNKSIPSGLFWIPRSPAQIFFIFVNISKWEKKFNRAGAGESPPSGGGYATPLRGVAFLFGGGLLRPPRVGWIFFPTCKYSQKWRDNMANLVRARSAEASKFFCTV